jgi:hypothetical protein
MKKLFFSLAVFSILFVVGCQENFITDPVSIEATNKVQNQEEISSRGTIPLEGILVRHGRFNSYYSIEGSIKYTHESTSFIPEPPSPRYNVHLNLSVEAVLTEHDLPGRNTWRISSESEDFFYVSEEGIYILEKFFPVLDRNDGVVLVCRFLITTDGIGLNAKWLSSSFDGGDVDLGSLETL